MKHTVRTAISAGLIQSTLFGLSLPCMADTFHAESTQTTAEIKAYSPKYRERIRTYEGQINTALAKGWLTPEGGKKFKDRLDELRTMEAKANANGYPKSDLDNVEKAFTQFNIDLTAAENDKGKSTEQRASASGH